MTTIEDLAMSRLGTTSDVSSARTGGITTIEDLAKSRLRLPMMSVVRELAE